jgi:hypothetical protein
MNLNGDEKRIQQLFRELSRDDRNRSPQFDVVLAGANSEMARSRNRHRPLRLATGAAILCALLLIAMAIIVSPSKSQRGATPDDRVAAPALPPETPASVGPSRRNVEAQPPSPRRIVRKRAGHRQPNRIEIAMKSLFAWRSPTASLLQTPGDELFRSLPRLGESLRTIKKYTPEQFN